MPRLDLAINVVLLLVDERNGDAVQKAANLGKRRAFLWRATDAKHNETFESIGDLHVRE